MKKITFNRETDWQFKPNKTKDIKQLRNRKIAQYNYDTYITWALTILKEHGGELGEGERYNTTALYMCADNVDYLSNYLFDWYWLCYSPAYNNDVPFNEVWLDVEKAHESGGGMVSTDE